MSHNERKVRTAADVLGVTRLAVATFWRQWYSHSNGLSDYAKYDRCRSVREHQKYNNRETDGFPV